MTRVWILNHYANTPGFPGPTRHFDLARRLVEHGFDVTIVASSFRETAGVKPLTGREEFLTSTVDGIRHVWVRSDVAYTANDATRVRNMVEYAWRVWRSGRQRFGGSIPAPSIVIGSSPHLLAPLVAWRLARRFRARFVFELRDLWPETFVAFGIFSRRHPIVWALHLLECFLYRRARRIVSLLPEAWRYIEQCGVSRDRVVWIPNGVAADDTRETEMERADMLFRLMYYGAMGRANALEELLQAAAILQEKNAPVRIILVGDGRERKALVSMAKHLALGNVEFRDTIPSSRVSEVASEADAFVALLEDTDLYQYGTSLNKVFSYMAAGKPLILAGRMAHNYVELAQCGLTPPPRDAEALADAIEALARTPEAERRAMGARGRAYVLQHHNWDLLGRRLAQILGEVTGGKPSD